jgi:uncharacterized protein YdaU (DUF1376 family)
MKKTKINIRFVQLEPAAFLSDVDVQIWNSSELGCFWMICLSLYTNNGTAPNDQKALARICHCPKNFGRIWNKIKHKFTVDGGFLSHKRVSLEIQRALSRCKQNRLAGSRGAKSRWGRHSVANGGGVAKEIEGKEIEEKKKKNSNSREEGEKHDENIHTDFCKDTVSTTKINSSFSTSVRNGKEENPFLKSLGAIQNRKATVGGGMGVDEKPVKKSVDVQTQVLQFSEKLNALIHPRTQSDRTCFRKVANFFAGQIAAGKCGVEIYSSALRIAEEAAKGRNPAACFMALVKKELNYR